MRDLLVFARPAHGLQISFAEGVSIRSSCHQGASPGLRLSSGEGSREHTRAPEPQVSNLSHRAKMSVFPKFYQNETMSISFYIAYKCFLSTIAKWSS